MQGLGIRVQGLGFRGQGLKGLRFAYLLLWWKEYRSFQTLGVPRRVRLRTRVSTNVDSSFTPRLYSLPKTYWFLLGNKEHPQAIDPIFCKGIPLYPQEKTTPNPKPEILNAEGFRDWSLGFGV